MTKARLRTKNLLLRSRTNVNNFESPHCLIADSMITSYTETGPLLWYDVIII